MRRTMPAVVNHAPAPYSVELRDMPIPEIGEREVLVQVEAVGVCGSDLHRWIGDASVKANCPCILGHEFSGVVVETGRQVSHFKEGDRITCETAAQVDEHSPFVRQGLYNLDPGRLGFGYGVHGAMTQFVRAPERCLHRIPDLLSFDSAALTEPCCVAYNAVCVNTTIRPGDHVLVLGPGPIGLLCALLAKLNGAGRLIVYGLPEDNERLGIARQLGADATLDAGLLDYVADAGDGYGVDVVIDAAGVSATLSLALQAVRPGGQVTKVGWGKQPLGMSLDPLVKKAVRLQGVYSHNWSVWERVIAMLTSGQIKLDLFLTHSNSLDNWEECFKGMHERRYLKPILKPQLTN